LPGFDGAPGSPQSRGSGRDKTDMQLFFPPFPRKRESSIRAFEGEESRVCTHGQYSPFRRFFPPFRVFFPSFRRKPESLLLLRLRPCEGARSARFIHWIPAFAGMTKRGAGMTKRGAGMTREGGPRRHRPPSPPSPQSPHPGECGGAGMTSRRHGNSTIGFDFRRPIWFNMWRIHKKLL